MKDIQTARMEGQKSVNALRALFSKYGVGTTDLQTEWTESGREKAAKIIVNGESFTSPDVKTELGSLHENKAKSPTRKGLIGLEKYRYDDFVSIQDLTQTPIFYTVQLHTDKLFYTASLDALKDSWAECKVGPSYCDGKWVQVPILYWSWEAWEPLEPILKAYVATR